MENNNKKAKDIIRIVIIGIIGIVLLVGLVSYITSTASVTNDFLSSGLSEITDMLKGKISG